MKSFRDSMNWLHTWAGLVLGGVLFIMFWMGTLSVFDAEIDRWTNPATRIDYRGDWEPARFAEIEDLVAGAEEGARRIFIGLPNERVPYLTIGRTPVEGAFERRFYHADTLQRVPESISLGGSGFFFPFHFSLHLSWQNLGYWIVGLAGIAMLTLLVSGLFVHRKIIAEYFMVRPGRSAGRFTLDVHNITSLVALPFHFIMPVTGLYIFFSLYFPWAVEEVTGDAQQEVALEIYGRYVRQPTGEPGERVALAGLVEDAVERWRQRGDAAARAEFVSIENVGDANGTVVVRQVFPTRRVEMNREITTYDATTGALLHDHDPGPVRRTHAWLSGLHFVQFDHWWLKWLYFVGGLLGCAMIATGFLFWVATRRRRHAQGIRFVDALGLGSTLGIVLATGAFLVANRLLPEDASWLGQSRQALEVWVFILVWLGAFAHAWRRQARAWAESCWAVAVTAAAAVLLNAVTTGDVIWKTLGMSYWPVAGIDVVLIGTAVVVGLAGTRLLDRKPRPLGVPTPVA